MDQDHDIRRVYSLLDTYHCESNQYLRAEALKQLEELQLSTQIWKISKTLIRESTELTYCFYGAQTLKMKTQTVFHELPIEQQEPLREFVLDCLELVNETTSKIVVTELSITFAHMLLKMTNRNDPVRDLIHRFALPKRQCPPTLLQILTVLPEEYDSILKLGAERKEEMTKILAASTDQVLALLDTSITRAKCDEIKILECLSSWIRLPHITSYQMSSSTALGHAFKILSSNQSHIIQHVTATRLLCSLILSQPKRQELHRVKELRSFEHVLIEKIRLLEAAYQQSVIDGNTQKARNYSFIFLNISIILIPQMLESTKSVNWLHLLSPIDLVLKSVNHSDYEVAQLTFPFWHKLIKHTQCHKASTIFNPFIEKLMIALHRHSQMQTLDSGCTDEFSEFRSQVKKLLGCATKTLKSVSVFNYYKFSVVMNSDASWSVTEASLFVMQAVAKNMELHATSDVVVDVVLSAIEDLLTLEQTANTPIANAVLLLLKNLSKWMAISVHNGNAHQLIERVFYYQTKAMQIPELFVSATRSFSAVCFACAKYLAPHFGILLETVKSSTYQSMSPKLAAKLLKAVTKVACHLPPEHMPNAMHELCKVHVDMLCDTCETQHEDSAVKWVDQLTTILEMFTSETNPGCVSIITYMTSALLKTFNAFQASEDVMERCCHCLRALYLCHQYSAPAPPLENLAAEIAKIYSTHRHRCLRRRMRAFL